MNDQERLQQIIETALKHGWTFFGYSDKFQFEFDIVWSAIDPFVYCLYDNGLRRTFSIETILYADNLSLLKAACGEHELSSLTDVSPKKSGTAIISDSLGSLTIGIVSRYQWVAKQSVILPENKRLAFICEHLRKD